MLRSSLSFFALTLLSLVLGCSSSNDAALFPVEGELKLNGQPLVGAHVVFHPQVPAAKAPPARAQTDVAGKFKLTTFETHDGAPAGTYAVTVEYFPLLQQQNEFFAGRNILPPKYASPLTTDLRIEVAKGANQLPALEIKR